MKHLPGSKILFILALALILLVNAFILMGVWYNRSGVAESIVVITEREIRMPYSWSRDETSVGIDWRILSPDGDRYSYYDSPEWFDQQKLISLGYELPEHSTMTKRKHFIETEVILVLEYDGEAYQQTLKNAQRQLEIIEQQVEKLDIDNNAKADKNEGDEYLLSNLDSAKKNLKYEELSASRLFVIDAGLNKELLRAKYPNNQRYILAYGIVDVKFSEANNHHEAKFSGRIDRLSVEYLHIENAMYSKIDQLKPSVRYSRDDTSPRFSLDIHYGQKLEPWIEPTSFSRLK